MSTLSTSELQEIDRANASGKTPVVFVHGLWLLASSWERWRGFFERHGYTTLAPGWPDEPENILEARQHPERFARKKVQQVTDHFAQIIRELTHPPVIIGHSFGGLIAQKLAGMGLAQATVAIDPAPYRGVLPLPLSTLRAIFAVLGNPANYNRAVALTYKQFRFAFANAVGEREAGELYAEFAVAAPARPLFQAATANLFPRTEVRVDSTNPNRGALLIVSGEKDNTVPWAIANASYKLQKRNANVTEIRVIPNRGHSLTIDSGWQEVAQVALGFVRDHAAAARTPGAMRQNNVAAAPPSV